MKKIIFISFATLFIISCSNNESIDLTVYNSELSIVQNLENGVLALFMGKNMQEVSFFMLTKQMGQF